MGAPYVLILLSVVLSAMAQIALKAGMATAGVQQALAAGFGLATAVGVLLNPLVVLGLAFYGTSAIVWLLVLSRMQVSSAYPFAALAIVLTSIGGRILFHDTFSAAKIAGTLLIAGGVVVLARG